MTVGVVDVFESVKIHHHQPEGSLGAAGIYDLASSRSSKARRFGRPVTVSL